jgi:hypothetical protein
MTLLDLKMEIDRQGIPGINVWKCSKAMEPEIGIDWMWFVGNASRGWLRFAVQAKKLNLQHMRYDSLNHEVSKGIKQIDVLENFAMWAQATPLYCLYNYVDFDQVISNRCHFAPEHCECKMKELWNCCQLLTEEQFGCTITHLNDVREALLPPPPPKKIYVPSKKRFTSMHDQGKAVPWRCLLCPQTKFLHEQLDGRIFHHKHGELFPIKETPEDLRVELGEIIDLGNFIDVEDLSSKRIGPRMIIMIDLGQPTEEVLNNNEINGINR